MRNGMKTAYNQADQMMRRNGQATRADKIQELLNLAMVVYPYRFYDHFRHAAAGLQQTVEFFNTGRTDPDAFTPAITARSLSTTNLRSGTNFMAEGEIFVCFGFHTTFVPRPGAGLVPPAETTLQEDIAFIEAGGAFDQLIFNDRDIVLQEVLYNIPKGITKDWNNFSGGQSVNNVMVFPPVASLAIADRSFLRVTQTHPNQGIALPNGLHVIQGMYLSGYRLLPGGRYGGTAQQLVEELAAANG